MKGGDDLHMQTQQNVEHLMPLNPEGTPSLTPFLTSVEGIMGVMDGEIGGMVAVCKENISLS